MVLRVSAGESVNERGSISSTSFSTRLFFFPRPVSHPATTRRPDPSTSPIRTSREPDPTPSAHVSALVQLHSLFLSLSWTRSLVLCELSTTKHLFPSQNQPCSEVATTPPGPSRPWVRLGLSPLRLLRLLFRRQRRSLLPPGIKPLLLPPLSMFFSCIAFVLLLL